MFSQSIYLLLVVDSELLPCTEFSRDIIPQAVQLCIPKIDE